MLSYRAIQFLLLKKHKNQLPWSAQVQMCPQARANLLWWIREAAKYNGKPIRPSPPSLTITSDASLSGWGAVCGQDSVGGLVAPDERGLHINVLELRAVFLGLRHFASRYRKRTILLHLDNTTAVAFINRQGGTRLRTLCDLAVQMGVWGMRRDLSLEARHIPGVVNVSADAISRQHFTDPEWHLDPTVFSHLTAMLFQPSIDLFASHRSAQLPRFVSRLPDRGAEAVDAFSIPWSGDTLYLFPPPTLVRQVLRKLTADCTGQAILVAPGWPQRPWFPQILQLVFMTPIWLDCPEAVRGLPRKDAHKLPNLNPLIAWPLSTSISKRKAFLRTCEPFYGTQSDLARLKCTTLPGRAGYAGVWQSRLIPLRRLSDCLRAS